MSVVLSLHYLPGVDWLTAAYNNPVCLLEAQEHFQKGSMRNRCVIAGPNGLQRLSIPLVKGKNQQMPIREVRIANDEPWQRLHWRSIKTAYGNAPYFEHYSSDLERFYEKKTDFLFDFNLELLSWLFEKMGAKRSFDQTVVYKAYADALFDFRGINVFRELPVFNPMPYAQVFQERFGFQSGLSGIDLLMCCGKHSCEILEKSWATT